MPFRELILPAGLRRIDAQETDQMIRMRGNVVRDPPIWYPHTRETRFTAKNYGSVARLSRLVVFLPANSEVDLDAAPRAARLLNEVFREVVRILKIVTMNVDDQVWLLWFTFSGPRFAEFVRSVRE